MAVPNNARVLRGAPLKSGLILGISPSSDPTFDVELARATSSGVYDTVARLTPKGSGIPVTYTDILPVDNRAWSYKARAVQAGWEPGDYTTAVTGRAIFLPEVVPNITPLTGKGIGAPLFISTGFAPVVGNASARSAERKYVNVSFTNLISANPPAGGLKPQFSPPLSSPETDPLGIGAFSVTLPPGVTVREATLFGRIGSSTGVIDPLKDKVQCYIALSETDLGSYSTVALLAITTTFGAGTWSVGTSTLNSVASTDNLLFGHVLVQNTGSGSTSNAGFINLRVGYDMPSYDKAL